MNSIEIFPAAFPLYRNRLKAATALNILVCLEVATCVVWTILLSQRVDLGGACGIRTVPDDTFYYWYARSPLSHTLTLFTRLDSA
jgi:hypothetical protein